MLRPAERPRVHRCYAVLVLDEVMQHLDVDGQSAMAHVLRGLPSETTLVIGHGLASDTLHGDFDCVDVVEKVEDASCVRVGATVV